MKSNVGGIDRALRILVGGLAIAFALLSSTDGHQWGLLGVIPLLTGLLRWCPFYPLLGISSCSACARS